MMFTAVLSTFTADLQSVTDYINEGKILFVKNACFIDYGVIDHIIKTLIKTKDPIIFSQIWVRETLHIIGKQTR